MVRETWPFIGEVSGEITGEETEELELEELWLVLGVCELEVSPDSTLEIWVVTGTEALLVHPDSALGFWQTTTN